MHKQILLVLALASVWSLVTAQGDFHCYLCEYEYNEETGFMKNPECENPNVNTTRHEMCASGSCVKFESSSDSLRLIRRSCSGARCLRGESTAEYRMDGRYIEGHFYCCSGALCNTANRQFPVMSVMLLLPFMLFIYRVF